MHRSKAWIAVFAAGAIVTGCSGYRPKPIISREVLRELQEIRLGALAPANASAQTRVPAPAEFNLDDGLSVDEAVAVALFLNPDLRALRKERGVADGELIAAGLLPNPQLQVTWLFVQSFTRSLPTSGWDVGVTWSPPRPGERGAKVARSQARVEEVRAQVAGEEWLLATEVRKAYAALWASGQRLRLIDASVALQERLRRLIREKLDAGDASRLDANLVELDYAERLRERVAIGNERERARLALNRLLGVPPAAEVALQDTRDLLVYRHWDLKPATLETTMVDRRDDLKAARQEYEQAEQALRLAYIQRIPWLSFGPAYQRNPQDEQPNAIGVGISIDLPLANLNQGEIARLEAARDKLREGFVARVHAARAEVSGSLQNLQAQERLTRLYAEAVAPALDESTRLADASLELGDVSALQFVSAQDKTLKARRDGIETGLEYWKAVFDLERAIGTRLSEVEGREE